MSEKPDLKRNIGGPFRPGGGTQVEYHRKCPYADGEELDLRYYDNFGQLHALQFLGDEIDELIAIVAKGRKKTKR